MRFTYWPFLVWGLIFFLWIEATSFAAGNSSRPPLRDKVRETCAQRLSERDAPIAVPTQSLEAWHAMGEWLDQHPHQKHSKFYKRLAQGLARQEYSEPFTHRGFWQGLGAIGNFWQRHAPLLRYQNETANYYGRARLLREALKEHNLEMSAEVFRVLVETLAYQYPVLQSQPLFNGRKRSARTYFESLAGKKVYDTPVQRRRFTQRPFTLPREDTVELFTFEPSFWRAFIQLTDGFYTYWTDNILYEDGDRTRLERALERYFRDYRVERGWAKKLLTELFACFFLGPERPKEQRSYELYFELTEHARLQLLDPVAESQRAVLLQNPVVSPRQESSVRVRAHKAHRAPANLYLKLARFVEEPQRKASLYDWVRKHEYRHRLADAIIQIEKSKPAEWQDWVGTPVSGVYFLPTEHGGLFAHWTEDTGARLLYWGNGNEIPQFTAFALSSAKTNATQFSRLADFLNDLVTTTQEVVAP